ncbi:MATE family efflux transporter [Bariatricus sp. HCP28S3_E4]|uniref:MATE family efflux transporter n=1 Tax=unclassified Bariatricus TaxID=2677046 RepID=UPI003F8AE943
MCGNAVILTIGVAVVLTAAGELVASPMLALLKTPENIVVGSLTYLRVMIGGLTVITFYNLEASLLRALGDGRSPLIAMVIASCTNIGLDLLFVMGFRLGIAGAAVATLMAQGISLSIVLLSCAEFLF